MSRVLSNLVLLSFAIFSQLSKAADVTISESSRSLRKDNSYAIGVKLGLVGASGVMLSKQIYTNTILEASYLRHENFVSMGSSETKSEAFFVGARQFLGNSFYLSAALGLNESTAVLDNELLKDYEMNVMYRDLDYRIGIGNRWELDDLWFIGCEWIAFQRSLSRLDHESSVATLSGSGANRAAAESLALKSAKSDVFGGGSALTLEMGLNF